MPISVHWSGDLIVIDSGFGCGVWAARPAILTVRRRAAARAMRNDAVFGDSSATGTLQSFRGSEQQSLSRFGSGKLQIISAVFNR